MKYCLAIVGGLFVFASLLGGWGADREEAAGYLFLGMLGILLLVVASLWWWGPPR